jgi:hypothetical protein
MHGEKGNQKMLAVKTPGFDTSGGRAILAVHEFHVTESAARVRVDQQDEDKGWETIPKGVLVHITDGVRRAIVPPESWEDYAVTWPACLPVINAARVSHRQRQADAANARRGDS